MKTSSAELAEALRVALKDAERLRQRNRQLRRAASEPIAIVGMSCRFPGGVSSPKELWGLLAEGRDGIAEFPADRGWDLDRLYDSDPDRPSTSQTREGGFVDEAAEFDAGFFGIAPREALAMDPQERTLLESSWEALEDAAIDPASLKGTQTGVYAGVMYQDYGTADAGMAPGITSSAISGRVAYTLGLEGPTMTVDTACSSSLVATHLATQALRAGECSLALAGGVTVLATPWVYLFFSRQGGLSHSGRCKSFADAADGTGLSEGVGMLVLERLSDAQRAGHPILATIKGSAVNQDGASNGLTAPNGPSQERVIRQALANAGIEPKDVDAVEAHGTGTTLGDPIEAGALLATYGQERDEPLRLGSIKSNIGHTQAAAGVAGVIKMTMAMRAGVLPKTLHVDSPSSKVEWEAGGVELLTEQVPWEPNGGPRRAGVSSFGASGTNAHLILEEAPEPVAATAQGAGDPAEDSAASSKQPLPVPPLLPLSAKSEPALAEAAARLASHLRDNPELEPIDVAYSLATTRSAFEQRAVAIGTERSELIEALEALAQGKPSANLTAAKASSGKLAYLLTGQGSQRLGMGKELYEESPVFEETFDEVCEQLDRHLDTPLKDVLFGEDQAALNDTAYAQPALFALQVSLYRALASLGLKPDLLTGHSVGEISAAHLAGVLELKDAAKLIVARGALMSALPKGGAMLAIQATEQEALDSIEGKEQEIDIAAINGPMATVLSGSSEAIDRAEAHWQEQDRKTKRLTVSHAFHSPLIEPMLDQFEEVAQSLSYEAPQISIVSNTSGEVLTAEQATDPAYWVAHVRAPVRFADAVATLREQGASAYLELGPDPVLCAMAEECLEALEAEAKTIPTLREGRPETKGLALSLASAQAQGAKLDWAELFEGTGAKRVPLPTYPFQRKRYWLDSSATGSDPTSIGQSDADHPLLSAVLEDPRGEGITLTGRLSLSTHPWLADHAVAGTVLLPGTAFLELALKAAELSGAQCVEELTLQSPLILPESGAVALQVSVSGPDEQGRREISIHSRAEGEEGEEPADWSCHAEGILTAQAPEAPAPLAEWPPRGAEPISLDTMYEDLDGAGFEYGPAFQRLDAAWERGGEVFAEVSLSAEQVQEAGRFGLHPALLDAAGHAALALMSTSDGEYAELSVPFAWRGVRVVSTGARTLRVQTTPSEEQGNVVAYGEDGDPVASIDSLLLRPIDQAQLQAAARRRLPLHRLDWVEVSPSSGGAESPRFALLGDTEIEGLAAERYPDLAALREAIAAGSSTPEIVVAPAVPAAGEGTLEAAHAAVRGALSLAQDWAGAEELDGARLCVLTSRGVSLGEGDGVLDLGQAPLWGLVRSAQSEHPTRFALLDTDDTAASNGALAAALSLGGEEPQLALREGSLLVPRLTRALVEGEPDAPPIDPERTVLITGGVSGLGALVARHLAERHGTRRLLLVSRSGAEAEGAAELKEELEALGAEVQIAACDVAERDELRRLLDSVPDERPIGAVFHSAAVLDDGVLESLDPERLQRTMRPKVDAAWHLHELTAGLDLSRFVMFSSAAGLLGSAAQANYAAANTFLDALAAQRRSQGLAASSLAWGGLALESAMLGESQAEVGETRLALQVRERLGLVPMPAEQGLRLLDAALAANESLLAPAEFDAAVLGGQAAAGTLPAILRALVRAPVRPAGDAGSLAVRLASVSAEEREAAVLELVLDHVAAVLGHPSATEVDSGAAFRDLGFDSLAAVELRNRLSAAAGLRLTATVVFDYPSPAALAKFVLAQVEGDGLAAIAAPSLAVSADDPIAIVGMSCRYPGGVASPEELWDLLAEGREGISEFPADRGWDLERLYHPDPDNPGTSYVRAGGFVADAGGFDPGFFGISPREALIMDPQERSLLEGSWEALESAGLDPGKLRGTPTGVFAGVMFQDYGAIDQGVSPGMTSSIVSGRVAYTLGLEGPTMTVDTACSSSLVAMHLAAQALRGGECSLALAGGVTVLSTPGAFTFFSRQRGLAPDGICKPFAEAADGTSLAEGTGVLVLERLSDAQRAGHTILATIKGSAVNQDGASNGLTAPNGPSQERVIRQALANAGIEPKDVDAVEAHGTGTTLGDPIEAGALLATYGQERDEPLRLGSIKSNIGHTQAAAGVAGVIKMTLAMREGTLPRTLHMDAPSSKVEWETGEIELLAESRTWERNGRPRRAAVSSFGVSGTNAHVILEEAPEQHEDAPVDRGSDKPAERIVGGPAPLVLSARSEPALREAAARLVAHMQSDPAVDPADVAYSLATTRHAFEHRGVALGGNRGQLMAALAALAAGEPSEGAVAARARPGKVAYLFSGHGSQWLGMGLELIDSSPYLAAEIDACEGALSPFVDWSLTDALRDESNASLDRLDVVQPALFALMVSLAKLWRKLGVEPAVVSGHSLGEIAAAHLAGGLSLEDASRLVAVRSRLIATLMGQGGLASISLATKPLEALIAHWDGRIEVAAVNGPASAIVSGEAEALAELLRQCEEEGVRARRLPTSMASHSRYVEVLREELLEALAPISPRSGEIPFHSTVTGGPLDTAELGPEYWYRNLRETVRFEQVTRGLLEQGHRTFVEISPHPVLAFGVQETIEDTPGGEEATVLGTLRRDEGGPERFALSLAEAHAAGAEVDWEALFAGSGAKRVPLPTYPFQRKRYWLSQAASPGDVGALGQEDPDHPLLGAAIEDPEGERLTLTGRLSAQTHPWLAERTLAGTSVLAGTVFLELALEAAAQLGGGALAELSLQEPLALPEQGAVQLRVSLAEPGEEGERRVSIHSRPEAGEGEEAPEWSRHAEGLIAPEAAELPEPPASWPPAGAEPLAPEAVHDRLAAVGLEHGPAFQSIDAAWQDGEEIYAELSLPEAQREGSERFALHPALLDALTCFACLQSGEEGEPSLPARWRGVRIATAGAPSLRLAIAPAEEGLALSAFDPDGAPLLGVDSLTARPLGQEQLRAARRRSLYRLEWTEIPCAQAAPTAAILGEVEVEGIAAERYPDLAALSQAIAAGAPAPEAVLLACPQAEGQDPPAATQAAAERALELAQEWIAAEPLREARLLLLSEGALALGEGEAPELSTAALWGLLRSAAAEHPGRFALLDADGTEASTAALPAALALSATEPQLALREGRTLAPRLFRAPAEEGATALDPDKTILIAGAGSERGATIARHLATEHRARHLLLVDAGPEAAELARELTELGVEATLVVSDPGDRERLAETIDAIPPEHPLGAVIHAAAVLDDGVLESLDPERLARVIAPKADAAWHLHELSADLGLSHFVLFSSLAGVLGNPGQASFAAANAFCDALAAQRRSQGLAATAIAWGHLEQPSERAGELFDAAVARPEPLLAAADLDAAALRAQAEAGMLPATLRGLIRVVPAKQAGSLAQRLAEVPEAEREALVLELVRTHAAAVLGHASAAEVEPERAFQELGFDSLGAVELRNRLGAATGLRLPPTLVFDYPSAAAMARYLTAELVADEGPSSAESAAGEALATLEATLASSEADSRLREEIGARLRSFLLELPSADSSAGDGDADLGSLSHDEVFELIDQELGGSR